MTGGVETPVIDAALVRRLVSAQFPQWAELPVRPVAEGGWDNRTFHLGEDLAVRLPSARRYAAAVEKEQDWLPRLAPQLPIPISVPVAMGEPAEGFPWRWSVLRWLPGDTAAAAQPRDLRRFARELADFLLALQRADAEGGPPPGRHSFHRGGDLSVYDEEVRTALARVGDRVDVRRAEALWDAALSASFEGPRVWVHGDVAPTNLLVHGDRLAGVIDFGQCCVGDPACDLGIAWTFFDTDAREAFFARLGPDPGLLARARAWTLWKALIVVADLPGTNQRQLPLWRAALTAVLEDA